MSCFLSPCKNQIVQLYLFFVINKIKFKLKVKNLMKLLNTQFLKITRLYLQLFKHPDKNLAAILFCFNHVHFRLKLVRVNYFSCSIDPSPLLGDTSKKTHRTRQVHPRCLQRTRVSCFGPPCTQRGRLMCINKSPPLREWFNHVLLIL